MHSSKIEAYQNIIQQAKRFGRPIPDSILNAPELTIGLELYLEAFFDLNHDRQIGMTLSPIPWSAMQRYAKHYDFTAEQTEVLFFLLPRLDAAYIEQENKKNAANAKTS